MPLPFPSPLLLLFSSYFLLTAHHATSVPRWHSFRLADFNGTIFSTTNVTPDPNPSPAHLRSLFHRLLLPHGITMTSIPTSNVALLDVDGIRVLIDAPASIASHLTAAGFPPESVDAVLLTHGHDDRVAGLITSSGQRAFQNADVYVVQREHESYEDEDDDDVEYHHAVVSYVEDDALFLIEDDDVPVRHVRVRAAHGHSAGHGIVEVMVNESRLIVTGDLWASTTQRHHSNTAESSSATDHHQAATNDLLPEQATLVRRHLVNEFASSGQLVLDFHGPFPGLGYVARAKKRTRKPRRGGAGMVMEGSNNNKNMHAHEDEGVSRAGGKEDEYGTYEYKWEEADVSRVEVESTRFHEQCLA